MSTETTRANLAKFTARQRKEYPYLLSYTRRGGRNTGVGLVVGSRVATSRENAEAHQRRMESEDRAHGHETTYRIERRDA